MSKQINAIIFDLDGMLIDSQPAAIRATRETLVGYNVNVTDDEVREQFGSGTRKYLLFFLERQLGKDQAGEYIDQAVERKNSLQQTYTQDVPLLPNAMELLEQLQNDGYNLGLATMSSSGVVERILRHHQINGFFNVVLTADDVTNKKPDPEILLKTAEKLGSDITRTLYVGDSSHDLEAAAAIGMPFILGDTGIYVRGEARKTLRSLAEQKGYPIVGLKNLMEIPTIAKEYPIEK